MDSKLTLKLDKEIIEKAKAYAAGQNRSLSRIIEAYLKSLVKKGTSENVLEISPYVKSMRSGISVPLDAEVNDDRQEYLSKKHD